METQTWKTDEKGTRHLASYDAFRAWKDEMKHHFETCKYEAGSMPLLPEAWLRGHEIFSAAPPEEQCLIASSLCGFFVEALRHWRTDLEKLYGKEQEMHKALMANIMARFNEINPGKRDYPVKFPQGV